MAQTNGLLKLDQATLDVLMDSAYQRLRAMAAGQRRRLPVSETLSTTALVHEAYLKVQKAELADALDADRFLGLCATAMRQILIDEARRRQCVRMDHSLPTNLDGGQPPVSELLQIDQALDDLAKRGDRLVQVVECRFFAGYTEQETARALGVNERTVRRDWTKARAYLARSLA